MTTQIRSAAILMLIPAMCGCSHESGTSPAPLSIVGVWNQGANLRETVKNQIHIHSGYFSFTEEGDGFAGRGQQSGVCRDANGDYAGPLATGTPYAIADGVQEGDRVSFKDELCTYEGILSTDDAHIAGTARCTYTEGGVSFVWTGDWLANREP